MQRLYGGWGAVLLRNVPQSIIKFLTYEQLKLAAISASYDGTLSTPQTVSRMHITFAYAIVVLLLIF